MPPPNATLPRFLVPRRLVPKQSLWWGAGGAQQFLLRLSHAVASTKLRLAKAQGMCRELGSTWTRAEL